MARRRIRLLLLFAVIMLIAYGINSSFPSGSTEASFVTKVIDGDTIVVEGGQSMRLLGIDTRERGENCYNEAKQLMEELVLLKNVTLEIDQEDKDQYRRLLRYVYVDGMMVNMEMIREGLAVAYSYEPNTRYKNDFAAAEAEARSEGGCVWTRLP